MTYKVIDPSDLDQYIGRQVLIVSDYGWDMNDWHDYGILRGIEDGYFYLQDDRDDYEYEDWRDMGGSAISCIRLVQVYF